MVYTYDEIGNPLNDGTWTYTWEHGRQLASMSDGTETWTYTYNADGLRTKRTNGTTTYEYIYNGSQLKQMTVDGKKLVFSYDVSGIPLSVTVDGVRYYYITNLQGDVIGILNAEGTEVVRYNYTAWGSVAILLQNDPVADYNPLLYRGYVYDQETELYYLQSRYYDPNMGRFLNADVYTSTGQGVLGSNMFAYCLNNPTTLVDPTGHCSYLGSIHAPKLDCGRYNCPDSASYCPDAIDITEELNSAMIKHSLELKSIADIYGPGAFMYFAIKSKKGSEWDLKNEGGWDLDETKVYRYGDQALREDDIGNIHYGFVGRTLTNLDTLLLAAGVVQIWDKSSDWSYWRTNFDEPRDQWAITIGYNLWEEGLRS